MRISDWSSDVCSSDLALASAGVVSRLGGGAALLAALTFAETAPDAVLLLEARGLALVGHGALSADALGLAGASATAGEPQLGVLASAGGLALPGGPSIEELEELTEGVYEDLRVASEERLVRVVAGVDGLPREGHKVTVPENDSQPEDSLRSLRQSSKRTIFGSLTARSRRDSSSWITRVKPWARGHGRSPIFSTLA